MRSRLALTGAATLLLGFAEASAQTPTTPLFGTMYAVSGESISPWCSVETGPSIFQRETLGKAVLTLPTILVEKSSVSHRVYKTYARQVRLEFNPDGQSGHIRLAPIDPEIVPFNAYSETYNAETGTLSVRLRLVLDPCRVVLRGVFQQ